MEDFTIQQRGMILPLFIVVVILQIIWIFEFDLWPLFMISMLFIPFLETIWNRREHNLKKGDQYKPMGDYRIYGIAVILNVILIPLVVLRSQLSYTVEFLSVCFGLFVATLNLFIVGRLLADGYYSKKRLQTPP